MISINHEKKNISKNVYPFLAVRSRAQDLSASHIQAILQFPYPKRLLPIPATYQTRKIVKYSTHEISLHICMTSFNLARITPNRMCGLGMNV